MKRDWENQPPKTLEDGFELAEEVAQSACDSIAAKGLGNPHIERTPTSIIIVWPDGEVTHEIEVLRLQ